MCRPWRWFWGILPLALIVLLALYFKPAPIESDLSARAASDLAAAGHGWAEVSVDGRDLTLSGTAPSEAETGIVASYLIDLEAPEEAAA